MRTLDAWRQAAGLRYQSEMPRSSTRNFASRVVRRRETASMQYSSVPDVGKPLSELAIGCMGFRTMPDAQAVYDTFFEEGRTVFDTANIRSEDHTTELQSLMRISYAVFTLIKPQT